MSRKRHKNRKISPEKLAAISVKAIKSEYNRQKWKDVAYWMDDRRRLDHVQVEKGGRLPEDVEKLMIVENEFFTATARWHRTNGAWGCSEAEKPISWMVRMPMDRVKVELLRMGARWDWVDLKNQKTSAPC